MLSALDDPLSYYKQLNQQLAISLHQSGKPGFYKLTFHNISKSKIVLNDTKELKEADGWFSGVFGSKPAQSEAPADDTIKLFLGYIQLFGYVVLNYRFEIEASSNPLELASNDKNWWENKEYINHYTNFGSHNEVDQDKLNTLDSNQFIQHGLNSPCVINGKLGGVDDLIIEKKPSLLITPKKFHLLTDLLYPFNSHDIVKNETNLHLNELIEKIIPFYTTSQSLIFTNITLDQNTSKTFDIEIPIPAKLPPSYNHNLTGPVCDNGLTSIRYSLNISVSESEKMIPSTVYFPVEIKPKRFNSDPRWLQPDYLTDLNCIVDKDWQNHVAASMKNLSVKDNMEIPRNIDVTAKAAFLLDLNSLIQTDLHNMPNTAHYRKKSAASIYEDVPGYIPQLPPHLKTSYQIRVNSHKLCDVKLSRPYFHVGEDINYIIDLNPKGSTDVKVTGYVIHLEAQETYHYESGDPLVHTYRITGSSKTNTFASSLMNSVEPRESLSSGSINVPRFATQQFQASKFMSLSYYLVFKFTLLDFKEEDTSVEIVPSGKEISEFDKIKDFRFENEGSELKFRLKVVILP